MTTPSLRRPNLIDRLTASALLLITPEYRAVKRAQVRTGRSVTPTLAAPPPMPIRTIDLVGERIRVAHASRPGAASVVLICPLPQSLLAFAPIWADLAERFDLLAVDLPGFGRSSGGLEWMTFEAQGRFLKALIDHFALGKPHLVGPDVGLAAAVACVQQNPGIATSLVIGDGPVIAAGRNGSIIDRLVHSPFWRFMVTRSGAGTFVEAGNRLAYVAYSPNPIEVDDYIASYEGRLGAVCRWFRDYPDSIASVDPGLEAMDLPVQIFWGDEDALLMPGNAAMLQSRLRRSRLCLLANCGHYSYQDRAREFSNLLIDWVEQGHRTV